MATYLPHLSNKNYALLTSHREDEKEASVPGQFYGIVNGGFYQNQDPTSGSYSTILPAASISSNNCVDSINGRNEMMFIPPMDDQTSSTFAVPRTQLGGTGTLVSQQNLHYQGLSLSLATQIQSVPSFPYHYSNPSLSSALCTSIPISEDGAISCPVDEGNQGRDLRNVCMSSGFLGGRKYDVITTDNFGNPLCSLDTKGMYTDHYSYQPSNVTNTIINSKYLKGAQELLDEIVNARKALTQLENQKHEGIDSDGSKENDERPHNQSFWSSLDQCESSINSSTELSAEERQDLQNKKTRLLSMLEDVDGRYKQYYHQMQIIISIFDDVAGQGAAEPYTALAKRTISCHFRSLRDAISEQIQVNLRKLGEQDTSLNGQGGVIPRLRYVDQQLRQQRAMQQLGVMRHAWRPQRGLPESSVSILRAWLFEHFLHPYPKDSEKNMLSRQTGLTKNQVANWFINARVRLWKPMIEEMYKEEFGDSDMKSKLDNALREPKDDLSASEDRKEDLQNSMMTRTADSVNAGKVPNSKCNHTFKANSNAKGKVSIHSSLHEDNIMDSEISKFRHDQRPYLDDHNIYLDETVCSNLNGDRGTTATYDIPQFDSFAVGSEVSGALKLQHCESDGFSVPSESNVQGNDAAGSVDYHCLDPSQQESRYNNHHLLHDFVV